MKFQKLITLSLFAALFLNMQCSEDDATAAYEPQCSDVNVIVDNTEYQNAESDFYSFIGVGIDGDCLVVSFTASGCSGDTWELKLVDSEAIMESFPPQRSLRFVLVNNEACLAVFTQQREFDIRNLRVEGTDEVILNIDNFEGPITYSY